MANEVKDLFGSTLAITINCSTLPSSTNCIVGRSGNIVTNTVKRYQDIILYVKLKTGASAVPNKTAMVYLVRGDSHATPHRSDGIASIGATVTTWNAQPILMMANRRATQAAAYNIYGECLINRPGPKWGVIVAHNMTKALAVGTTNHYVRFVGMNPEVQ